MGISTRYYTFYGVKASYPKGDEIFVETLYERDRSKFDHVLDGMNGEDLLLGKALFKSHDLRWDDFDGDDWKTIPLDSLAEYDKVWREGFLEDFPDHAHLIEGKVSELFTFAHYS